MQAAILPVIVQKIRVAAVRGVLFRLGLACLPLLGVVLLCWAMFMGLGRARQTVPENLSAPLLREGAAAQNLVMEPSSAVQATQSKVIQAGFHRLGVTHAIIHVPD